MMQEGALPHARLLSAHRRHRERRPTRCRRSSRRCCSRTTSERQGRVIDHDAAALDGEEEAGGLFLMAHVIATSSPTDIDAYLDAHEHKSLLRFITCGSVDDGKSTLIGRLLYESKMIFEDQLAALEADSKQVGTQGGEHRLRAAASTAWPPSASRASPSTSRTASSRPSGASSSSPTRPGTSSTRATWSPARRPRTSPSS